MISRVDDDDNDENVTIAERAPNDIKGNAISSIFFFKNKWAFVGLFFVYFRLFKQTL